MVKNNKDLDKLPEIKKKFSDKALELRSIFGEFLYSFLCEIIEIPENCHLEDIIDILAQDVEINTTYVKFKMIIISNNIEYLEYIDKTIDSNIVFNMFPGEYFRFTTDSYNDAIAKAYPELFENKHQDQIGVGADGDVFCHSFTFQTSEACNLQCTYCFKAGTKILMADKTYKNIEDIKIGDMVYGFKEYLRFGEMLKLIPTEVTNIFRHESNIMKLSHDEIKDTYITPDHPILTANNRWIRACELTKGDGIITTKFDENTKSFVFNYIYGQNMNYIEDEKYTVYNFETKLGTYVANDVLVHNCYQFAKTPMRMEFETAKKFIDNLLADKYGYINRYNSPAIIIEFIGGEPFLEIKLTRQIYEYFLDRCYELNHPWFYLHRVSICSNGLLYFEDEVQNFFKDYSQNISFNISIDGNKELHDSCRIQPNGEGSYNICITALNHYNRTYSKERNSKMTLAPSNINYMFDSIVDFIKNDMKVININCVFEEGWNQKTAKEEYYQLKKLADYLIDNNLENIYIAIFNERQEDIQSKENDGTYCGGSGSMLAMRPNGQFYPCIRYMPTSVGNNVEDLCIGSVDDGLDERSHYSHILERMDNLTRRSMNNDICYDCPINNDCPSCTALGHGVFGTFAKRANFICIQMIAEALANVYYWNRLALAHPEYNLPVRKNNVPDEWSLLVIDEDELKELRLLEGYTMIKKINK